MTKSTIYLIGIAILGLVQAWAKSEFGNVVFFITGCAYLIALVVVAEKFGKRDRN